MHDPSQHPTVTTTLVYKRIDLDDDAGTPSEQFEAQLRDRLEGAGAHPRVAAGADIVAPAALIEDGRARQLAERLLRVMQVQRNVVCRAVGITPDRGRLPVAAAAKLTGFEEPYPGLVSYDRPGPATESESESPPQLETGFVLDGTQDEEESGRHGFAALKRFAAASAMYTSPSWVTSGAAIGYPKPIHMRLLAATPFGRIVFASPSPGQALDRRTHNFLGFERDQIRWGHEVEEYEDVPGLSALPDTYGRLALVSATPMRSIAGPTVTFSWALSLDWNYDLELAGEDAFFEIIRRPSGHPLHAPLTAQLLPALLFMASMAKYALPPVHDDSMNRWLPVFARVEPELEAICRALYTYWKTGGSYIAQHCTPELAFATPADASDQLIKVVAGPTGANKPLAELAATETPEYSSVQALCEASRALWAESSPSYRLTRAERALLPIALWHQEYYPEAVPPLACADIPISLESTVRLWQRWRSQGSSKFPIPYETIWPRPGDEEGDSGEDEVSNVEDNTDLVATPPAEVGPALSPPTPVLMRPEQTVPSEVLLRESSAGAESRDTQREFSRFGDDFEHVAIGALDREGAEGGYVLIDFDPTAWDEPGGVLDRQAIAIGMVMSYLSSLRWTPAVVKMYNDRWSSQIEGAWQGIVGRAKLGRDSTLIVALTWPPESAASGHVAQIYAQLRLAVKTTIDRELLTAEPRTGRLGLAPSDTLLTSDEITLGVLDSMPLCLYVLLATVEQCVRTSPGAVELAITNVLSVRSAAHIVDVGAATKPRDLVSTLSASPQQAPSPAWTDVVASMITSARVADSGDTSLLGITPEEFHSTTASLYPISGPDMWSILCKLGAALWHPQYIAALVTRHPEIFAHADLVARVPAAQAYALQHPDHQLKFAGIPLRLAQDPVARVSAWPQLATLIAYGASTDTVKALYPSGVLDDLGLHGDIALSDAALKGFRDGADGLIADAEAHACFAPYGMYRLPLPESVFLLRNYGVSTLLVSASPAGFWVRLVDPERHGLTTVWWQPHKGIRPAIPSGVAACLHLTLAALWRDSHVAGERAVPSDTEVEAPRPPAAPPARSTAAKPVENTDTAAPALAAAAADDTDTLGHRSRPPRLLPRPPLHLAGIRQWGSPQQRVRHKHRKAHYVGVFIRHLPETWKPNPEAKARAAELGVILPDAEHYTVVRPHLRGLKGRLEEFEPDPTEIRAAGLNTVGVFMESFAGKADADQLTRSQDDTGTETTT